MANFATAIGQPSVPLQTWEVPSIYRGQRCIIPAMTLNLVKGQWTALLGESGVGKTTLLKSLAGLSDAASCHEMLHRISYMAQQDSLLPWKTVFKNVVIGDILRKQPLDKARAISLLERVGLGDKLDCYPQQLSAGMRHRVALARTLYEQADLVLLDEPFSSLDTQRKHQLYQLTKEMLAGKTVLHVTHDPLEALHLADHIFIMRAQPTPCIDHFDFQEMPQARDIYNVLNNGYYHRLLDTLACSKV